MTKTVIHMTHSIDRAIIIRLFSKFANKYGKLWTSRLGDSGDWDGCIDDWLEELKKFSLDNLRDALKKAFVLYTDYPPTQGQLIELCIKESGIPSQEEILSLIKKRDFTHPLAKMVFEKIGSWTLANSKEEDLNKKAKELYSASLAEFYCNPAEQWKKLAAFNVQPQLEAPAKIPSKEERRGFKERYAEAMERAAETKEKLKDKSYRKFPENETDKYSPDFNQATFEEYRKYLLSLSEEMSLILPTRYAYHRIFFLREIDTARFIKEVGYIHTQGVRQNNSTKSPTGASKVHKIFGYD